MALTDKEKEKIAQLEADLATQRALVAEKTTAHVLEQEAHAKTRERLSAATLDLASVTEDVHTAKAALAASLLELEQEQELRSSAEAYAEELNEELSRQAARPVAVATVSHEGQAYRLDTTRFHLDGAEYAAADVTEGSELLARLVELQAGFLIPVE